MKTTGVVRRIDDLGRIVIPKDIRKSLRIREGESLEFFVDKETISLKKFSTSANLDKIAQSLLDSIYKVNNKSILVTDRDKFVACSGKRKKEFFGFNISSRLENYLFHPESIVKNSCLTKELVDNKFMDGECYYIISPILFDGETIGLVLMIRDTSKSFSKEDENCVQIIANFLSKYLED